MKRTYVLDKIRGYYFITDNGLSRAGSVSDVRCGVRAGVGVVQYRNKDCSTAAMYKEAFKLRALSKKSLFIVNDRIDIAVAVDADGVHLGQDDMPLTVARQLLGKDKIIGVSVCNPVQAAAAFAQGADYLGVGPIFSTATKLDAARPVGIDLIRAIDRKFDIPLVAIGGITLENAPEVIAAGADAVCAISAVITRFDVVREIKRFQKLFL